MKGKEIWKDILGYEGKYMVSNWGRVKSLNYHRTGKERIMKPSDNGHGYLFVVLCKDGKDKKCRINRLVAQAFLPNPDNLPEVNHKDENKYNNCVENLEWCDRSYNINYGTRNKRIAEKYINDPNKSKTVVGINEVNGSMVIFPSSCEAERQTGIFQTSIIKCCKGKRNSAGGYFWFYLD